LDVSYLFRLDWQSDVQGTLERRSPAGGTLPFAWFWLWKARCDRAACLLGLFFVVFALPTSLLLAIIVPPGEVPDEPAHLLRADSLLYGEILGERRPVTQDGTTRLQAGLWGNWGLFAADLPGPLGHLEQKKMSLAKMAGLQSASWSPAPQWIGSPTTAIYMPHFYLPEAAVFGVAQLLHLSPYHAILAARLVNALCFVALGISALLVARKGRILLFCALTLPMTVSLAASCNPDGLIIATSALAFALLTRARGPNGLGYWIAACLLAAVIAAKIPYLPLAFLLLIPCAGRDVGKERLVRGLQATALAIVPGTIWAAITMYFVSTPYPVFPAYHPGRLWPGNPSTAFDAPNAAAQILVFVHRPLYPLILPIKTLETNWTWVRNSMLGMFGWIEFGLQDWMYRAWSWALGFAILGDVLCGRENRDARSFWVVSLLDLATVAITFLAIYDAEYLIWTRVGAPVIDGVQGRYLIPLLPALAASLPTCKLYQYQAAKWEFLTALPALVMAAIGMVVLPWLMVSTYYLR
jgi:uncharacterized membrane protein